MHLGKGMDKGNGLYCLDPGLGRAPLSHLSATSDFPADWRGYEVRS